MTKCLKIQLNFWTMKLLKTGDASIWANKANFLKAVSNRIDEVGDDIGKTRKAFDDYLEGEGRLAVELNKENFVKIINKKLDDLIDGVSPVLAKTTHKEYIKTLDVLKGELKTIRTRALEVENPAELKKLRDFYFKDFTDTMKVLARKSKFTKREKAELEIDKAYREAYGVLSKAEDDIIEKLGKNIVKDKKLSDQLKNFANQKDRYSRLKTAEEALDYALPTGTNFTFLFSSIGSRDGLLALMGYALGGVKGAIAGGVASKTIQLLKNKGTYHLGLARLMESNRPFMMANRSMQGVRGLLDKASTYSAHRLKNKEHSKISIKGLGAMFFERTINNMQEFNEALNSTPPEDVYSKGLSLTAQTIEQFGGRENAMVYLKKTADAKRAIVAMMPEPSIDEKGNRVYTPGQTKKFLNDVNQGLNPLNFIQALHDETLTQKGYNLLKQTYPEWLSTFNMNFMEGYEER